jgi:hypothetical protein
MPRCYLNSARVISNLRSPIFLLIQGDF